MPVCCAVDLLAAGFFFAFIQDILTDMGYEVTATRRRPKTFDEMAGQDFVVSTLKSSIETGQIAHAYLFSGPRGCGKTSAARILARSLNCEKGPTAKPCGTCTACIEIGKGSSLDVIEIDGASNTSVNDIRQIKDEVLFPPNSSPYKIYIIDEVHMLSNSAFNALLKTIEEPPPYIIFIFATTELHKVPATIKSRCQQFNFRLFSIETLKEQLALACAETGIQADDEALFWIAKEATGSMRDAYTLLDQVSSFSQGHLRADLIRQKLGLTGMDAINDLVEVCVQEKTSDAILMLDEILEQGVSIEQCIIDLASYFRSLLLLKNGITKEALLGYTAERFSALTLETLSSIQIERALELLLDAYRDIRYSVSPRYELDTLISKLCWLRRWVSPLELRNAVDGVRGCLLTDSTKARWGPETKEQPNPEPAPSTSAMPETDKAELDLSRPGAFSEGFKRFMEHKTQAGKEQQTESPEPESFIEEEPDDYEQELDDQETIDEQAPLTETVYTDPGHTEQLKERIIQLLKKERGMLASGLEKSKPWEWQNGGLIIPVCDTLSAELLGKETQALNAAIKAVSGSTIPFKIEERKNTEKSDAGEAKDDQIFPQTELVRRMFKGTIVKIQ